MRRRGHSSASTWYFSQRLGCWIAGGRSALGHRLNGKRVIGTAWGCSTGWYRTGSLHLVTADQSQVCDKAVSPPVSSSGD